MANGQIDQSLIQRGLAGGQPVQPAAPTGRGVGGGPNLFQASLPGLFGRRELEESAGDTFGTRIAKRVFPGLFAPTKAEREVLENEKRATEKALEASARGISGALNVEGLGGEVQSFPAVRDAIQAAAAGDQGALLGIQGLIQQHGKTAQAARDQQRFERNLKRRQEIRAEEKWQKYQGMTPATWGDQVRSIGRLRHGQSIIMDLNTLNKNFGREALPGTARGAYDGLRGQLIDTVRILIEAKALQEGEITLIKDILPEFGAFAKLSAAEREVQLNELNRWLTNTNLGFMMTTPNADKVIQGMPPIQGRSIEQILATSFDEPEPPAPIVQPEALTPAGGLFPGAAQQPDIAGGLRRAGSAILEAVTPGTLR